MSPARGGAGGGLWPQIQSMAEESAGISIQVFDAGGGPVPPMPKLPTLCAFLQSFPATQAACRKDCFGRVATCRDVRRTGSARCYAGLSYRLIPIRGHNRLQSVILVGRVLTQVFGGEQFLGFIEKYKLSRKSFEESLAGMRSLGSPELERVTALVRRLAVSFVAADTRAAWRRFQAERKQQLVEFGLLASSVRESGPGRLREMLESLGRIFAATGVALLAVGDDGRQVEVKAAVGLGEGTLDVMTHLDWAGAFRLHGQRGRLVLSDPRVILRSGLGMPAAPLVVQRFELGSQLPGYLVLSGAALKTGDLRLLQQAAAFVGSRIAHQQCRERAEQKADEARLLGLMTEKCLAAHTVEELLPLALDAAMCSLRARRGSIFLADEEQGLVTARAVRGVHAPISETIAALRPGSVSHRVFFERRPLLVRDAGREPGPERERQFPYTTRSFVSVPLREDGHAFGVLHLTEREGEENFTPADLSFLETLGLQASRAIRQARLEEEVRALRAAASTDRVNCDRRRDRLVH